MKRLPCRFFHAQFGHRTAAMTGALLAAALLSACSSTPRHTNVLMFGTNTKLALDVSQDPATGMGVSLGYKRQEAVWMPLLPNVGEGYLPASCETQEPKGPCPKYVGNHGNDYDTYSVLASFGFDVSGSGTAPSGVNAGGKVAQFFATGLAARTLAQTGGAALVNTNEVPLTALQKAGVAALAARQDADLTDVLKRVTDKADASKVDNAAMAALLAGATGANALQADAKLRFASIATVADLKLWLTIYDTDAARLANVVNGR